jgi:hypothetical protein
MTDDRPTFRTGTIRPVECIRGGWRLIKDQYWLFTGIAVVGGLIAGLGPMGILVGPMMCGIYLCLLGRARGETVKFEMLFRGFEYFLQSFIATLIMMIPILIVVLPAYVVFFVVMFSQMPQQGQGAPPPDPNAAWTILGAFGLFFLAVFVVSIVVSVLFFFTYPLIVDRKLTGVQAVGTSFRAARANFGGVLGLVLLTTLLSLVGVLACYVGVFFVMPIHFAAVAVAYRQVFPEAEGAVPPADGPEADDYKEPEVP